MAKANSIIIKLVSSAGTGFYYTTRKNPRGQTEKLSLRKFDPRGPQARDLQGSEDQVEPAGSVMPYGRQRRRAGVAISVALAVGLLQSILLAPAAARADMQAGWQAYTAGDYEAAIREWQPLAEDGDYQAAYALGMAFQIKGEPASAVPWYEQAASAGLAEAQILLGTIYARGNDVPRDLVRAYAWLYRAVEKNSPNAQLILESVAGLMTPEEIEAAKALSATL